MGKLTKCIEISSIRKSRKIKRPNGTKYLKIWDDQIKQLTEAKKKIIQEMAKFKEARRQNGIQKKHSNSQKRSEKKTKSFLGKICYKFRT
jgi:hypothetical protein